MSGACDPSGDALTFPVGAASTPPTATAASRAKLKRSSATGSPAGSGPSSPPRSTARWERNPAVGSLAWLLTRPAVSAPIIGPRTRDQLDSALAAVELSVSPEQLRRLDEIFPGHKTAPEDYAW
jgi:aryl-alcohol dehydrogenase-like predicted oxidoreductase